MALHAPPPSSRVGKTDLMPQELREHLAELQVWAAQNRKEARQDAIAFWSLKVPAILASASAGLWTHWNMTSVSAILGAVASVCVIVDGVNPRGVLRNTHLRAYHDIQILTANIVAKWRARDLKADERQVAQEIILSAEKERNRIASYVRDAETAWKTKPGA